MTVTPKITWNTDINNNTGVGRVKKTTEYVSETGVVVGRDNPWSMGITPGTDISSLPDFVQSAINAIWQAMQSQ